MVRDSECDNQALPRMKELLDSADRQAAMCEAIQKMAVRGAAEKIVDEIEKIVK